MGMDSETLELLTLWRGLPAESKARMLEKARYVALSAGLEKAPEFVPLFEQPATNSVGDDSCVVPESGGAVPG
jgi:hypothetical protein